MNVLQIDLIVPRRNLQNDLDQLDSLVHDLAQLNDLFHAPDQQSVVNHQKRSLNNRKLELQQQSFLRIYIDQGHSNLDITKILKVC